MTGRGRTADFSGLGAPLRRLPLRGRIAVGGSEAAAELCLTSRGLWLVAPRSSGGALLIIDLLANGQLRYETGRTSDRLFVNGYQLATQPGRSRAVRETIALGRLRANGTGASSHAWPAKGSHLVRGLDARTSALLERELAPGELVVAFVGSSAHSTLVSALSSNVLARWYWLVTDRRACLLGLSELGDVASYDLDAARARIESGRLELPDASGLFRQSTLVAEHLLALSRMPRGQRLSAAAQLEWQKQHVAWAQRLLAAAAPEHADAAFALELVACDARLADPHLDLGSALDSLRTSAAPPETLAALVAGFGASNEAANLLLAKLRPFGARAEPWALELHRDCLPAKLKGAPLLAFAQHLLAAGQHREVMNLLAPRLELASSELDLVTAEPAPSARCSELVHSAELAAEAAERCGENSLPFAWALARLDPLSPERMEALGRVATGELRTRVELTLAALAPGGLIGVGGTGLCAARTPLARELVESRLPHPLARAKAAAMLQGALAGTSDPDRELLRSWCERLSPGRYPAVVAAAQKACNVLGLPEAELFVSRGDRSLGVRAFSGRTPLVVIGGAHLDSSSLHELSQAELDFALGAELTHVRFGHERATPREVWLGALGKARLGVELVLTALPLAKSLDLGARATRLLDKVPATAMQRALTVFTDLQRSLEKQEPGHKELGRRHEELVLAHRQQQLTADRGGLLIAADLIGSLRALFTVRSDHQELFSAIAEQGLAQAGKGALRDHAELLLRVRALLSFYLSADFPTLLAASSR